MILEGVVMLVNEFPPLPVGGAERQAERLSLYLAQRGWQIHVITRAFPGLTAVEARNGITVERVVAKGPGKIKSLVFVTAAMARLWRLRREYRVLHAHLAFGPAFAAVIVGRLLNKRVIIKLGNSGAFGDVQVSEKTLRGRLRLAAFRRWADRVIALDDTMENEALAAGFSRERVRRMPNGIDAQQFNRLMPASEARSELGLPDKTTLLFIGRLSRQKNLEVLLRAFVHAVRDWPEMQLLLVGDGPDREMLERLTGSLGVVEQVKFAGNQKDVRPYLNAADIFVLPSTHEGISNALLEAMAAELACVATPVGGTSELLDFGRCGILAPPDSPEHLGTLLANLASDPERVRLLGRMARQRILAHYDFTVVGARYEALYRELMELPAEDVRVNSHAG